MEVWRAAKYISENGKVWDFTGLYECSNLGRVRSLDKIVSYKDGRKRLWKGKIMKLTASSNGYLQINLYISKGVCREFRVHRLIASTFPEICGKWFEGAEVNHKTEIKSENQAFNLEWVSKYFNCNYGNRNIKQRTTKSKNPINQYSTDGTFLKEWLSSREIERQLGFSHSNIIKCCKGNNTAYGYIWRYKEERAA